MMNIQKFTQKSIDAITKAQELVIQNQNAQVEQEHILLALLEQENSLIKELLKKMNVNIEGFCLEVKRKVDGKAKMSGGARSSNGIYVAQDVDEMLVEAENIADRMKDDYVSVEHIMIAMLDKPNKEVGNIFKTFNIKKEEFLKVLKDVRGNVRVTTDNPESTYDALSKYGQDLVDAARKRKVRSSYW